MQRYIAIRIIQGIIALLLMTMVVFFLARLTGNPLDVMLPENASEADYIKLGQMMGLDKPIYQQYLIFMRNITRGDFGTSFFSGRPASQLIIGRLPATIQLAGIAALFAIVVGFFLGVMTAVKKNTWLDSVGKIVALLGQSAPTFWVGLILMTIFAVNLKLLPVSGYGSPLQFILPAVTLGYFMVAGIMRITRSSMIDALDSEFIKLLRTKGLPEKSIIWVHGVKNGAIPVLTFASIQFLHLVMGAVVCETVFAWPGIGLLAYDAIIRRDFPVMQGIVLLVSVFFIVGNLLVDIAYAYLDPRIRYQKT